MIYVKEDQFLQSLKRAVQRNIEDKFMRRGIYGIGITNYKEGTSKISFAPL
jgi:hypothetical protein